jgi:hypothetical protein
MKLDGPDLAGIKLASLEAATVKPVKSDVGWADSVSHNLVGVMSNTVGTISRRFLSIIDLHSLISLALTLALFSLLLSFLFILTTVTLALKIFTLVSSVFFSSRTSLSASLLLIFLHNINGRLAATLGLDLLLLFILFGLFSAIFFAVRDEVSLGLLGWELRRSRFF